MALNINGTTGISGVDGSVSAPAVTGTHSNTGITFPSADTIKFSTGGVERMSITNSGVTGAGGGKILQVVNLEKKDTTSLVNNNTRQDISGMTLSITPTAASSKILVHCDINIGTPSGGYQVPIFLMRNVAGGSYTDVAQGTDSSGLGEAQPATAGVGTNSGGHITDGPLHTSFLDSPSYSLGQAINYKWQWQTPNYNNITIYLNRNHIQTNYPYNIWRSSRIILMEVAA